MQARALFRRHDPVSQTKYQELKQLARTQKRVLNGTPGTLKQRTQSGKRYWMREYIRVDGRKVDEYLGPEASIGETRLQALRAEIDLARALASGSGTLRLLGYQRMERKAAAVLEVFFNRGLIQAGLTLVGAHAYGALLNELGVLAPAYKTQDIDVARSARLAVALHRPSASFKLPGAETLAVDLLIPGQRIGELVAVKELQAHAQAVPLLDFLIAEPLEGIVLSPNQVIPVKLPSPERFILHKLFASQSRTFDRGKAGKDLDQAATLAAVLEEETPGRLSELFRRMPAAGRLRVKRAARIAAKRLADIHPQGAEALQKLAR